MQEVAYCELRVMRCAVEPDAPYEEREDGERVLAEVAHEVEYGMIVERHTYTHVMKRRRITLQVLYRIGICMEYVRTVYYRLRHRRGTLYKVVVVGIHAGYHVSSHLTVKQTHQSSLLSTFKMRYARGQHHLEIAGGIFKPRQYRPPEKHVIVAFHICHYAAARLF